MKLKFSYFPGYCGCFLFLQVIMSSGKKFIYFHLCFSLKYFQNSFDHLIHVCSELKLCSAHSLFSWSDFSVSLQVPQSFYHLFVPGPLSIIRNACMGLGRGLFTRTQATYSATTLKKMFAPLPETINCQQTLRPWWRTLLLNPCPTHDEILMDLIMCSTVSMNPWQSTPPSVGDVDALFREEHSTITYSQHPGQLWAERST